MDDQLTSRHNPSLLSNFHEIVVTVIATGFEDGENQVQHRPSSSQKMNKPKAKQEEPQVQKEPRYSQSQPQKNQNSDEQLDTLDIPTFLRNRRNRNR